MDVDLPYQFNCLAELQGMYKGLEQAAGVFSPSYRPR